MKGLDFIDGLALLVYPGTLIGVVTLAYLLSSDFALQIKERFVSILVILVSAIVSAYMAQMFSNTYSRYYFISKGIPNPSPTSDFYVIAQAVIMISLWAICILYLSRNDKVGIRLPQRREKRNV